MGIEMDGSNNDAYGGRIRPRGHDGHLRAAIVRGREVVEGGEKILHVKSGRGSRSRFAGTSLRRPTAAAAPTTANFLQDCYI